MRLLLALTTFGGEILYSIYFSLEPAVRLEGGIAQLTLRGRGNGHGVGMCQWGAVGRARAGVGFHEILRSDYPWPTFARLADAR